MTRLYAHRGASAEHPENTLPAFARAIELGVYGIELDVHLSQDGVPVVIHDESVDRTTDGEGEVAGLSLADRKRLDAGGGARIPTLEEVLDLVGDALHVDIEVKAAAAADAVLVVTARRPELRYVVSSFDHDVLRNLRVRDGAVELWPLANGATDEALAAAVELGSSCIAIDERSINTEIIAYLRSLALDAWVWTVNDPNRARELAVPGVAGICTDDPAALTNLVDA